MKYLRLDLPQLRFPPELTEAVASLSGLERFYMCTHTRPSDESARQLAGALGSLPNLRSITLFDYHHVGVNRVAAALTEYLPRLPHLQSLALPYCVLSTDEWHAVAENLRSLHTKQCASPAGTSAFHRLDLGYAKFGDQDIAHLAQALSTIHGLRELNLAGNNIGPAGMAALAASLRGMKELQVLELSAVNLHDEGMRHLADALETLPRLKDLGLLGSHLDADDMRALGAALRGSHQLQRLQLSYNPLTGCSAADWVALLGPPRLEDLNLNSCSLGPQDMAPLAAGLQKCPTLKSLALQGNAAGTIEAAQALAGGLAGLSQLEECILPKLGLADLQELLPTLEQLRGSIRYVHSPSRDLIPWLQGKLPDAKVN